MSTELALAWQARATEAGQLPRGSAARAVFRSASISAIFSSRYFELNKYTSQYDAKARPILILSETPWDTAPMADCSRARAVAPSMKTDESKTGNVVVCLNSLASLDARVAESVVAAGPVPAAKPPRRAAVLSRVAA
jgi:hypothetical protein